MVKEPRVLSEMLLPSRARLKCPIGNRDYHDLAARSAFCYGEKILLLAIDVGTGTVRGTDYEYGRDLSFLCEGT